MYDWGDLKFFLATARRGSTLAAARELGVNQTTIARRIAALETDRDVARHIGRRRRFWGSVERERQRGALGGRFHRQSSRRWKCRACRVGRTRRRAFGW